MKSILFITLLSVGSIVCAQQQNLNGYKQLCEAGKKLACQKLGEIYANGIGVRQSFREVLQYHRRVCDLGLTLGCSKLGAQYVLGQGTQQSSCGAAKLLKKDVRSETNLDVIA